MLKPPKPKVAATFAQALALTGMKQQHFANLALGGDGKAVSEYKLEKKVPRRGRQRAIEAVLASHGVLLAAAYWQAREAAQGASRRAKIRASRPRRRRTGPDFDAGVPA
jgi:hypothetical protein